MAFLNDEKNPTGPQTAPDQLLPSQRLSDEESLAYAQARRTSARSARLRALLGLAFGLVVLWLAGRKLAADLSYPQHQRAQAVDDLASSTPVRRALPIVLQPKIQKPTNKHGAGVCTTPACTEFASVIRENLAKNYTDIDPCTDFAEYVCGGWQDTHFYRPDQSSVNSFSLLADENNAILRSILENPYPKNSSYSGANETANRKNFAMMKTAFTSCMDEDTIKEAGIKPLKDLLENLPGAEALFGNTGSIDDSLVWLARHGVDALVSTGTTPDDRNPDVVTIVIGGGSYGLPSKEYYDKPDILANYSRTIANMFGIVNEVKSPLNQDLASKIVDFEKKIAKAQPDPDQQNDVTYYYNPKPFSEVDELVSQISISKLINAFIPTGYKPDQVIVLTPDYFPQLSTILNNTPMEVVKGYFQWQLIKHWSDRLHRDFNRPIRIFNNQLNGRPENAVPERWRTCLAEVDNNLEWIESAFYIQSEFGPDDKQFGERIIDDIRAIYTERLDTYDWMADAVKKKAKQKVANIVKKIGYPDASPNVLDPVAVRNFYANISVSKSSFFGNGLTFGDFSRNSSWNDLLKPTDKKKWGMTAPTVNAYYNPPTNEIAFPAGIMKDPFFNKDVPKYISYGSFGVVAGHELTHGFDNSGSQFDENGAYKQWWDNTTRANFNNLTQCFVDQYSKFTVPGLTNNETLHVNGRLTLGENIADAGGVSASYAAWTKRNAESPDQLLPNLPRELTQKRLFFVSFATAWCQNIRREALVEHVYTDPHSPNNYRTIGTLANSRPFREAFDCPVKQPTCDLW